MRRIGKPENVILVVRQVCRVVLCLGLVLACYTRLLAQRPQHSLLFRSIGVNEGLSHSSVYSLLQDSKGYIWLGTADGLNRYDGREIKVYRPVEAMQQPEAAYIRSRIAEDLSGNIWYLGFAGLFCWDRKTEQVVRVKAPQGSPAVYFLDDHGVLWYHDLVVGIRSYDLASKKEQFYPYPFQFETGKFWNLRLATDDKRYLWFSVYKGGDFYRFDLQTKKYQKFSYGDGLTMLQYENGKLWLSDDKNIAVLDAASMEQKAVNKYTGKTLLRSNICRDKSGALWLSLNGGGLYCIDAGGKVDHAHPHDNQVSYSIPSDNITALMEDRTGNLWVATDGGGVSKASLREIPFGRFPADDRAATNVKDLLVWSIFEQKDGKILFSTDNGGLHILDPLSQRTTEVPLNSVKGQIRAICSAFDGEVWVGYNGGVKSLGARSTVTLSRSPYANASDGEANVLKLVPVSATRIFAGTTQGLRLIEKKSNLWQEAPLEIGEMLYLKLTDIEQAGGDKYWMAYQGYGLLLTIFEGNKVTVLDSFLYHEGIREIHKDETDKDLLWLTSKTGLWRLNTRTRQSKFFNTQDGLANANVYGILEDASHNLWLSTNGGLSCYNRKTGSFSNYTHNNGLQSNEFNSGAFHKGASGKLYFGGVKGFNWLTERTVAADTTKPGLLVTKIAVADSLVSPYTLRNDELELSYRKNYFDLQVLVADYTRPEANIIKYRLNGWDKDWQLSQSGEIHYASLPAGNYTLDVVGMGSARVQSKPYRLHVRVVAPFWQQAWFRIGVGLTIVAIILGLIYFNYRRKISAAMRELEQQKLLAEERNRISRDLHDDIGSAITKISLISELIPLQRKSGELVLEDVKKISTTARTVSQSMSDIVWALHAQHDNLEGLLSYMREQVREFLAPLGMNYELDLPDEAPEVKLNGEQRRNILLVTKEALNNAVKYAEADRIVVACSLVGGVLEFRVCDNGKGFDIDKAREHGNGLKNMRKRMESIGGELKIEQTGRGTTIVYRLNV